MNKAKDIIIDIILRAIIVVIIVLGVLGVYEMTKDAVFVTVNETSIGIVLDDTTDETLSFDEYVYSNL